ncbi:MAG: hypothetical protein KatS3mg009_2368 [Acidimicrobiia bacterium]|nr:MAG: hypothetical protein KatS3mg009_2368 [Acidimicrobiia bacterium]
MPVFSPFAGVRYDCATAGAELGRLAAPPYDVVDDDEHAALEAAHPHNSVRLILPRDEHAKATGTTGPRPRSRRWCEEGVLVRDPAPRFYAYRMEFTRTRRHAAPHPRGDRRAGAARAR